MLVAVGRRPRTAEIGAGEGRGPSGPGGYLEVDDQIRVDGSSWLYAIGDVNGRALLTHMGKYQARIAGDAILGREVDATVRRRGSPRVVFTDPEVAAVGMTLGGARRRRGSTPRAVDVTTSANASTSFRGRNAPGTSRLVIDEERRVIVGATFGGVGDQPR